MQKIILVMAVCVMALFLSPSLAIENTCMRHDLFGGTYHNATLIIVSNIYCVKEHSEKEIVLHSFRQPFLPGIFYVSDENGIEEFNAGGWMNSIVTIKGFQGFFKDWLFDKWGLYVVIIGKCDEISIEWFR